MANKSSQKQTEKYIQVVLKLCLTLHEKKYTSIRETTKITIIKETLYKLYMQKKCLQFPH